MISTLVVRTWFSGAHDLGSGTMCTKMHGHRWSVKVSVAEDRNRFPDPDAFQRAVIALRDELHLRNVTDMIMPSIADVHGIAAWFMERLSIRYPISEVEVWQDDELGSTLQK